MFYLFDVSLGVSQGEELSIDSSQFIADAPCVKAIEDYFIKMFFELNAEVLNKEDSLTAKFKDEDGEDCFYCMRLVGGSRLYEPLIKKTNLSFFRGFFEFWNVYDNNEETETSETCETSEE